MDGMRWLRRRRGVDLGTYVAPEPVAPAPVSRIVADGLLIGDSVVRLTLRNRIIVDVLRDRIDLDRRALGNAAARQLARLADQEWESAERIKFRRDRQRVDDPLQDYAAFDLEHLQESLRRERIHRASSDAFAARVDDREAIAAIVERARAEAWSEISDVLMTKAGEQAALYERDPDYDAELADRLAKLVDVDLAELQQTRTAPPAPLVE